MDQKELLLFKRVDNFSSPGLTSASEVKSGHRSSTQVGNLTRYLDRHRSRSKAGKSQRQVIPSYIGNNTKQSMHKLAMEYETSTSFYSRNGAKRNKSNALPVSSDGLVWGGWTSPDRKEGQLDGSGVGINHIIPDLGASLK